MTANKVQVDRGASLMAGEERRRSQRVIMRIPVSLEIPISGEVMKAKAHTVAVNVHGAMLLCSRPIDAETKLEIENDRTRGRASARVTSCCTDIKPFGCPLCSARSSRMVRG